MPENQIVLDSKLISKIYAFIKHPLVTLAIGIIIPLVISLVGTAKKLPRYYFSQPRLIADSIEPQDSLKIYWNNKFIQNLYYVDFTFWNNGRKYIDAVEFIESNPIHVYNTGDITILSVNQINISREEIQFRSEIADTINSSFNLHMNNDETLEYNDGATFHIIYTMASLGNWNLSGRIKGFPNGIEQANLAFNETGEEKKTLIILWCVFFVFTLTRITILHLAKKPLIFRPNELIFLFILLIATSYMTFEYFFLTINLPWYS